MSSLNTLKSLVQSLGADFLENEPMSRHTTFKIGGPADIFIAPKDVHSLEQICNFCEKANFPKFILGNGSNLLVSDKGIRGAVIYTGKLGGITRDGNKIICGAGVKLKAVCDFARDAGLAGLEFAYGIPGSVGGAVYMNAGAYGGEMKDVVSKVYCNDGANSGSFKPDELDFGYRHSVFSGTNKVVTQVEFTLQTGDKNEITKKMKELMERRKTKQPLEWPSAGSVFKRPVGNFAGTLIEKSGLKGTKVGGAMVSEKHAGFIVNAGGATCKDVLDLIEKVREEVFKQTGIMLEREIRTAGEV